MQWKGRMAAVALLLGLVAGHPAIAAMKSGGAAGSGSKRLARKAAKSIDNDDRMNVNNLDMFVTNHGSFGWDLATSQPGLRYPNGTTKTALFAAGIWVGAKVNGEIRTAVGEYSQEYSPGPMYNGTFQVDQPAFKNYRLDRGNTTSSDFLNWPSAAAPTGQGAPLDSLGNPLLLGDATIWSVYNDANPAQHINTSAGQTLPLGLEVQQTTFAYKRGGALGDIIFLKFLLINKGANQLDDAYVSIWADPDLGDAADDLVGCDTTLSLGYCYNEGSNDAVYGSAPPAIGFDFFKGPTVEVSPGVLDTLGMTSFNKYINGEDPQDASQGYNLMQGLQRNGSPLHVNDDPLQPITTFQFPGDPVTSTGWLDVGGNDRRMQLSSGPFFMAPGDTQEVVCAVIVAQGTNALDSITKLKQEDAAAQLVFDLNFDIPSPPPSPIVFVQPLDRKVRLIWDAAAVGTNSANASLGQDFHFEGYRVWQLQSNNAQANPRVIATYDLDDSVAVIYSDLFNSGAGGVQREIVVNGENSGLQFSIDIDTDAFSGSRLVNNHPYYFAVTAYSFDVLNTAPFIIGANTLGTITEVLESSIDPVSAIPKSSNAVFTVNATQISGDHVGHQVLVEQLEQNVISADTLYQVNFLPDESWIITNTVSGDTLATGTNVSGDFDYPIINGFMPRVISATKPATIYQILQNDSLNMGLVSPDFPDSAGVYYLDNEIGADITGFNFNDAFNHDYEILTLPDTTQFAWEYNFGDPSPQTTYKVPFRIFDLGVCSFQDPSDDVEVTAMIRDDNSNGRWDWGDRLYIRDIPYASVPWGTAGLLSSDVDPNDLDNQTLGRFGFERIDTSYTSVIPPAGERIRIRGGRLCPDDAFTFRLQPVGTAPGTIVQNDVKKILAVPNPYYAHSAYELTQFDRTLKFTNIPASRKVTIRIFNLAGDLVRTIRREPTTADEMAQAEIRWDLNTDRALPVGSGLYIYRVDVDGVGSKTDRMAIFIEKERLDNF
jgi:hypothetical protein